MSLKLYLYKSEQNHDNTIIQKRISILFALSGLAFFILNITTAIMSDFELIELLKSYEVLQPIILSLLFFSLIKIKHTSIRIIQILFLIGSSSLMIIHKFDSIYGCALWLSAYLLTFKYGIYHMKRLATNLFFIFFMLIMIILSLYLSPEQDYGWNYIIFLISFITLTFIINQSEIDRVLVSEKNMQNSIHQLIQERTTLKNDIDETQKKLSDLRSQIKSIQHENKPFDFKDSGLTPAEMRIVEALVTTRGSNKEISKSLGIKENTVKQHLYKVFNKMGVDDRFQIIDLCKYNFT